MQFLQDFWANTFKASDGAVYKALYKQDGTVVVQTHGWNFTSQDAKILHDVALIANMDNITHMRELSDKRITIAGKEYTTVLNELQTYVALSDPWPAGTPTSGIVVRKSDPSNGAYDYLYIVALWNNITSRPDSDSSCVSETDTLAAFIRSQGYTDRHLPH